MPDELSDAVKKAIDSLGDDIVIKEGAIEKILQKYETSHTGRLTDLEFDTLLRQIVYDIQRYDARVAVAKVTARVLTHAIRWGAVCLLT